MYMSLMRKSFKDSLKVLEADIQHANTLSMMMARRPCQPMKEELASESSIVLRASWGNPSTISCLSNLVTDPVRRTRSQLCPFCRNNLKRVNSGDLWIFMDSRDVVDVATVTRENLRRLFMYIDKLPLVIPDNIFETYDSHLG
ncbi:hypothetical protein NL676_008051 [Syzygium grande]|nr:hypothetical protein NL676_008051 [Syzygium grande]